MEGTVAALLKTFEAHQREHEEDAAAVTGTLSTASPPETQNDDCPRFLTAFSGVLTQMGQYLQKPYSRAAAGERLAVAKQFCEFLGILLQQKVCPMSHIVFGGGRVEKVRGWGRF